MNQERKDKLNELHRKLSNLTDEEKQSFIDRGIIATIQGRTLSLHNTYMLYLQSNGNAPTVVGGYKQWKQAGRQVMKGQHGLTILFPSGVKNEDGDIEEITRFFAGTVFDITQTEVIEAGDIVSPAAKPELKSDSGEYKHTYNIYKECPDKTRDKMLKQLEAVDKYNYSKPSQPYPISHYPFSFIANKGPEHPYGDIEIMVDGKPGLSLNGDSKAGKVKSFMRQYK